jgi:hypothetical protein
MAFTERSSTRSKAKAAPVSAGYGNAGLPIDKGHPFYFGFLATLGALSAFVLLRALASASQVFVIILISLFRSYSPSRHITRNSRCDYLHLCPDFCRPLSCTSSATAGDSDSAPD